MVEFYRSFMLNLSNIHILIIIDYNLKYYKIYKKL
jgi:hypothetical protein